MPTCSTMATWSIRDLRVSSQPMKRGSSRWPAPAPRSGSSLAKTRGTAACLTANHAAPQTNGREVAYRALHNKQTLVVNDGIIARIAEAGEQRLARFFGIEPVLG